MSEFGAAMTRLREAQKSSRGAPAYSRFVNRPLGRPMAAAAYVAGLTPTQVTLLSGVATLGGILAIALLPPTWWSSLLVAALLVLGYALDSADGQLARLTGRGSLAGEWLDHFFDAAKAVGVHIAVLLNWYRFTDLADVWLLVPLGFTAVASVFFFGVVGADLLRRIHRLSTPGAPPAPTGGRTSALYSLAVVPADYGLLCIVFLTLWLTPVFVFLYTALAAINALLLLASGVRWYRSVAALERS
ncbi:CDP-alcohol phosphatidyltransferase family protein [Microbacterium gorillae]|uniref:CDP-alcohol phosphatidyltransferase family protein n=1 Tax=Microbacterium gorillae TaxID=1231063 RepID=UPI00058D2096|nr:CDP-alcohol phosphatidyltransferase family protein [Microbacterium gorillae]